MLIINFYIFFLIFLTNIKFNICFVVNKNPLYKNIVLCVKKNKNHLENNLFLPKNINQQKYTKYLDNDDIKLIFSIGPAGTGKTLFACQKAITELKNNNIKKIIVTRPIVHEEEDIGFLPGNLNKKMDPWTKPIFDIFLEYYTQSEINLLLANNQIEICPLFFMRGRTFKNSFVIADEMQNSSPLQMKMLLTRIGENSKLIVTGDLEQTDISKSNGLEDFFKKFKKIDNLPNKKVKFNEIKIINFSNDDIERSELVKNILNIYDNDTNFNSNINVNNDSALIPYNHFNSKYYM